MDIVNIIPPTNIGFDIPNIKRLINVVAHVMQVSQTVIHVAPLRIKQFSDEAYAVKQGCEYVLFLDKKYLAQDRISPSFIRIIIHEMFHIKQMMEGRLKFNYDNTKAIFEGKEYTNFVAHNKRPFEVEAKRAEAIYYGRVKELIKELSL